ncbi:MAG TPA: hypothetical protein VEK79_20995 [Thermoanaerobaculia bacterium]|nr:hypothetical protein [Thermoanaerobaculia bacterium]
MNRLLLLPLLLACFACREQHPVETPQPAPQPAPPTATQPAPAPAPAPIPQAPKVNGPKLTPVDEAASDPSFVAYRNELLGAVRRRDADAVVALADPNIRTSFGGTGGADDFRRKLGEPGRWEDLERLLTLGGSFRGEGESRSFWAPYVYSAWPDSHDAFEQLAITGEHVPLRESSEPGSRIIATLSYDIVERTDQANRIRTADGKTGYVDPQHVRSPVGYRAGFMKTNGQWRMNALVAGD